MLYNIILKGHPIVMSKNKFLLGTVFRQMTNYKSTIKRNMAVEHSGLALKWTSFSAEVSSESHMSFHKKIHDSIDFG